MKMEMMEGAKEGDDFKGDSKVEEPPTSRKTRSKKSTVDLTTTAPVIPEVNPVEDGDLGSGIDSDISDISTDEEAEEEIERAKYLGTQKKEEMSEDAWNAVVI